MNKSAIFPTSSLFRSSRNSLLSCVDSLTSVTISHELVVVIIVTDRPPPPPPPTTTTTTKSQAVDLLSEKSLLTSNCEKSLSRQCFFLLFFFPFVSEIFSQLFVANRQLNVHLVLQVTSNCPRCSATDSKLLLCLLPTGALCCLQDSQLSVHLLKVR